ncbi:DUF3908 family protein [Bacillus cereus]|uniref:DUF3908 family protein n=1 Tax=Bacillus cereus TaxID=1396 RepID=UPI000BF587BF|nr:DUF3908 family protein [Bacillus cereus]MED3586549.1 DUF3908 family protein [Bacillus thuringiensis]PFC97126.1 hypothetical protein CN308_07815 [Bacillus cereus]
MGMTYEEFKNYAYGRDFDKFEEYQRIIKDLAELYGETNESVFFYPRNVWREEETELIFFFNDGYLTVEKVKEDYQYEHVKCKVLSKTLTKSQYEYNEHKLKVKFDNGREFFFSSTEDTNKHWVSKYSKSIIDLYKVI